MSPDSYRWRAGTIRVLANALLVLLAFEVVSLVVGVGQMIATGPPTLPPIQLVPLLACFILVRWIFVLPGAAVRRPRIVARRVPHACVLTASSRSPRWSGGS